MLVQKRRPGQGIVFGDGGFRIKALETASNLPWLQFIDVKAAAEPILAAVSGAPGSVRLTVASPRLVDETDEAITVETRRAPLGEGLYSVTARPGRLVVVDGISIEFQLLHEGQHAGEPLMLVSSEGLSATIEVAVLNHMKASVDIATSAPPEIRIYRDEIWDPTAGSNEQAAAWDERSLEALSRQPAATPR